MSERDTVDFVVAFAVGAAIGAGLVLLLNPGPPAGAAGILEQLEPYRADLRRRAHQARKARARRALERAARRPRER